MKFNKDRITESVINIVQHDRSCMDEYMNRMIKGYYSKVRLGRHVEAHKEVFGQQSYCWNGEFRYWVWDFETWRVYVSNHKGVAVEVNQGSNLEQTMAILKDYWTRFGV